MDGNHSGIVVTLADIYAAQQEQAVILAEIKGTLALQSQQDRNDKAVLTDHESRLRKLETKVYAIPGAGVLLSAAALAWAVFGK